MQGNKAFENLKYGLPDYEMYDIVWGSSNAVGNLATPSANLHLGRDVETANCDDEEFEDNITMNTYPHSGDKRPMTFDKLQNKRNMSKGRISYEDSISAMVNAYLTLKESRQSMHTAAVTLDQVVDIIMAMFEFDMTMIARVLEFFRMNESSHKMFLKFSHTL